MIPVDVVRRLRELITAIDRRVPQRHRSGESVIADDAARLRAKAVQQIEDLGRRQQG